MLNELVDLLNVQVCRYKYIFVKKSPICQFFELVEQFSFKDQVFYNKLVLRILATKVIMENQLVDEMWFKVDGAIYWLRKQEFATVPIWDVTSYESQI